MSTEDHQRAAHSVVARCAVVTVSDTRKADDDVSGALVKSALIDARHEVVAYEIVPDEPERVSELLHRFTDAVDAILLNGGTGISTRDRTFEAVSSALQKTLPGFGELFRMLSFEEVGAAAMLSRAVAGVRGSTLVFSMPGSPNAVSLAMNRLVIPQLAHLVWELRR